MYPILHRIKCRISDIINQNALHYGQLYVPTCIHLIIYGSFADVEEIFFTAAKMMYFQDQSTQAKCLSIVTSLSADLEHRTLPVSHIQCFCMFAFICLLNLRLQRLQEQAIICYSSLFSPNRLPAIRLGFLL